MKKILDLKEVGQFVSVLLSLFTAIRDTFAKMNVGVEIIPWLLGDGKKTFVEEFLKPLGTKFLATERVRVVNKSTILVNLDASPKLPFDGVTIEAHVGGGWVKLEKRKDGLYVDGRKVVLYLSERQKNGNVIKGYELRDELSGKPMLNANILDALCEHTELIPEEWKGKAVFFWGTVYRDSDDDLFVRCLYFHDGEWSRHFHWLGHVWDRHFPAALRAS